MRVKGPWAEIYLDGTKLASTRTINGLKVPVGTHSLRLVRKDLGLNKTIPITIEANKETKRTVNFE